MADDRGRGTTSTGPAAAGGYSRVAVLVGALRRFAVMFFGIGGLTVLLSLLFGALAHASLQRSIAVGFYLVGCTVLVFGFFVGNRGPLRHARDPEEQDKPTMFGMIPRGVRRATPEERKEAVNVSFLFIVLGLSLIILGALSDSAHKLF